MKTGAIRSLTFAGKAALAALAVAPAAIAIPANGESYSTEHLRERGRAFKRALNPVTWPERSGGGWTEKNIANLLTEIGPGALDESDERWRVRLAANPREEVEIMFAAGDFRKIPARPPLAVKALGLAAKYPDANRLRNDADPDLETMAMLAFLGDPTREQMTNLLATAYLVAYSRSNAANGYKPINDLIAASEAKAKLFGLDSPFRAMARRLIFDSAAKVDAHAQGHVPNAIYERFGKPEA